MAREGFVYRRRTHIAQNTRHCSEVIDDFVSAVNDHIAMMNLPPELVVNIDETDLPFDIPANVTLARRGRKSIDVAGNGSSNRATALLAVTLTGEKLPMFLIFKAKRGARVHKEVTGRDLVQRGYPENVVISVQQNAWMDTTLMKEWIDRVWEPWLRARSATYSYLIMDCFSAHLEASVLQKLADCRTEVCLALTTPNLKISDDRGVG